MTRTGGAERDPRGAGQQVPALPLVAGAEQKSTMPRKPFGKPVREIEPGTTPGRGGGVAGDGQPPFIPTDTQRQRVMDLIACSFTHEQIAIGTGIPLRTLERHFQPELATGRLRAHADIAAGMGGGCPYGR